MLRILPALLRWLCWHRVLLRVGKLTHGMSALLQEQQHVRNLKANTESWLHGFNGQGRWHDEVDSMSLIEFRLSAPMVPSPKLTHIKTASFHQNT